MNIKDEEEVLKKYFYAGEYDASYKNFSKSFLNYINDQLIVPIKILNINSDKVKIGDYEVERVRDFLRNFGKPGEAEKFLINIKSGSDVVVNSPLTGNDVRMEYSLLGSPNTLFVRFANEDEVFYIVQNVGFIDGIFIPSLDLCLTYGAVYPKDLKGLYYQTAKYYHLINQGSQRKLGGFYVSHHRPYHYYYNCLPALQIFLRNNNGHNLSIFSSKGADFFDLGLIEGVESYVTADYSSLNKLILETGIYLISLAFKYSYLTDIDNEEVKNKILKAIDVQHHPHLSKLCNSISKYDLVIWIGITGQKRSWQEQIAGLKKLVSELAALNKRIFYIFDGWTSPLNKNRSDYREIEIDRAIVDEVVSGLEIEYLSLIGMTSSEKIIIGKCSDFFFCGWGSAGIHVSRFLEKNGVSHFNNTYKKNGVIDKNGTLVPAEYITDILPDRAVLNDAHISYSMNIDDVIPFVISKLTSSQNSL